jgi:tetratricopeptide (TPR) repeat protein
MGAEEKAAAEAHLALSTDSSLPAQQRLNLEASAYNYSAEWPKAMETYAKLRKLHPDELDYALGFANAQTQAGNPKEALQTLRSLSVSSKTAANDPRVSQAESYAASSFNDWSTSLYYAGEALRLARATSSRTLEINALILEGSAWGGLGNAPNGIADFESAERLSTAAGDLERLSQALSGLGQLQQEAGDPAAAIVTLRRAVDIDRKVGDRSTIMMVDASLGGALVDVQDWAGARRCYQELLDMAQPAYPGIQPLGLTGLAGLAAAMGNFDEERSYANRALILSRKVEDAGDQADSLFDLAQINLLYGNVAAAGTELRQASDIANRLSEPDLVADSLRATAQFDIEAGDLVSARKMVDQALAMHVLAGPQLNALLLTDAELKIEEGHPEALEAPVTALGSRSSVANPGAKAWRLVAESWLLRGDIAKARIAIDKALALARKSPNSAEYLIPDSIVSARIDAAEGHTAQASAELSLLLRESQRINDLPVQLEIRLAQGKLKKQCGDLAGSTRILQAVQTEATQRGFGLIAQKARQAESAS